MENLDQSNNKNVSLSLIAEYGSESDSEDTRSNENTGNDSDAVELSDMVLKNNIINACAHGPLSEGGDSDVGTTRHMIIDSSESGVVEYDVTEYRDMDSDSSSSDSSSDSEVDSVKDIEEMSSGDELEGNNRSEKLEPPKVHGELELDDLPPVEDLAISLPAQETVKIGTVASIVDRLVIVRAFPGTPAVDLDSVLFLENGAKTLGKVFDVLGAVKEPHYCVRFNSAAHVSERGVARGADVFIAPRSGYTNYVFLSELMKEKGSDASWLNDVEPPPSHLEFSDDEEERRANRAKKEQHKQNRQQEPSEDGENSNNPPPRKMLEAKRSNQRPSESSSRFGGTGRGRGSVPPSFRRAPNFPRARPWDDRELRTPPPHPNLDPGGRPFVAPPMLAPPLFDPSTPPPYMMSRVRFNRNPRMVFLPMNPPPPLRQEFFPANYCRVRGPQQWLNRPPPPPGT